MDVLLVLAFYLGGATWIVFARPLRSMSELPATSVRSTMLTAVLWPLVIVAAVLLWGADRWT